MAAVPVCSARFTKTSQPLSQIRLKLIDACPHVKPQIGRNLLVATASTVQLVSDIAYKSDELLLHEVMNVFRFVIFKKFRRRKSVIADLLQPLHDRDQFARREDADILQRAGVCTARSELVTQ